MTSSGSLGWTVDGAFLSSSTEWWIFPLCSETCTLHFDMPVVLATGAVLGQGCCLPVVYENELVRTVQTVQKTWIPQRSSCGCLHARCCANNMAWVRQWRKLWFRSCIPLTKCLTSLACRSCRFSGAGVEQTAVSHSCSC